MGKKTKGFTVSISSMLTGSCAGCKGRCRNRIVQQRNR